MPPRLARALNGRLALVAAVLIAGCPTPDPAGGLPATPLQQALDYNEYVCNVMPTLVRRCSFLACHGNADHALRIYSPGKLRLGGADTRTKRTAALTAGEVGLNFESAAGVANGASEQERGAGVPTNIPLLVKPLAARFGGGEHQGIAIFPVYPHTAIGDDPEYAALAAWVAGRKQPTPIAKPCADVFSALNLTPRGAP
jgi:hypothetical protein